MDRREFGASLAAAVAAIAIAGEGKPVAAAECPALEFIPGDGAVYGVWRHEGLTELGIVAAIRSFSAETKKSPDWIHMGTRDMIAFLASVAPHRSYGVTQKAGELRFLEPVVDDVRFAAPGIMAKIELSHALPPGRVVFEARS